MFIYINMFSTCLKVIRSDDFIGDYIAPKMLGKKGGRGGEGARLCLGGHYTDTATERRWRADLASVTGECQSVNP